ncbi:MAG: protein-L-isoaspartate O-methyltransferase [Caldisphaera sp.]|jgi:protein-L-isoaspartate(D-aspartate) O-methyltransferase|nr:MAG: protein-L-isoaspartate O-methyltransferase [Caldisphaera sp.]
MQQLKNGGYIKSNKVEEAMIKIDRALFVPSKYINEAYDDKPIPIGFGQTVSAPSIVSYMTELLQLDEGHKVLEIGTGSGYQTAILAYLVKETGHVWSIERIKELSEFSRQNLEKVGLLNYVTLIVGDGSIGYELESPYDRIIITAASPRIPNFIKIQLKNTGKAVLPVGDRYEQKLVIIEKDKYGNLNIKYDIGVIFVPLVGLDGFLENN